MAERSKLDRGKTRERTKALILEGLSDAKVAAAMSTPARSVSRQAITAFRGRHATDLAAMQTEAIEMIRAPAITEKANRISEYAWIYDELRKVQDEHGFAPGGRFSGRLSAEMRATLDAVAEELGQKPRADINIDNRIQLLVRTIGGADVEEIV